jgi:hypothetical protein
MITWLTDQLAGSGFEEEEGERISVNWTSLFVPVALAVHEISVFIFFTLSQMAGVILALDLQTRGSSVRLA